MLFRGLMDFRTIATVDVNGNREFYTKDKQVEYSQLQWKYTNIELVEIVTDQIKTKFTKNFLNNRGVKRD